jgi:hypothetical protein
MRWLFLEELALLQLHRDASGNQRISFVLFDSDFSFPRDRIVPGLMRIQYYLQMFPEGQRVNQNGNRIQNFFIQRFIS